MGWPVVRKFPDKDRDDCVGDEHSYASHKQYGATTESIEGPKTGDDADELGYV
jgi:hypothetical protein